MTIESSSHRSTVTRLPAGPTADGFASRHLGPDDDDVRTMLQAVGQGVPDELIAAAVRPSIALTRAAGPVPSCTEHEALAALAEIAGRKPVRTSLIGAGYYGTTRRRSSPATCWRTPLVQPRTPLPARDLPGTPRGAADFQTVVTDLTGMDLANASLLDEATAAARP